MKCYQKKFAISVIMVTIVFSVLNSCGRNPKEPVANQKIKLNPTQSEQIKLSEIFSTANVYIFNTNDIVYYRPDKMIVKNGLYFMLSKNMIIVCNEQGDLVLNLSKRGNGPGEYLRIDDFQVEDNGNIIINDNDGRQLISYNLQGEHVNTIHHNLYSQNFIKIKDKIFINSGDFSRAETDYRVNVWNESNQTIEERYIKREKDAEYVHVTEYTNFSIFNDTLSYSHSFSNIICQLVNGQAIPRIEIDFGKHNLPKNYMKDFNDMRVFMENLWKSTYASRIDGYSEGSNFLFFAYTYQDKRPFCWLSKKDNKIYHFDKFEDDLLFPGIIQKTGYEVLPIFIDENYYYISMEAYRFIEFYNKIKKTNDKKWENQKLMDRIYNQINEESNALIIRYKIK